MICDPEATRPYFRELRGIRDQLSSQGAFANGRGELSMGMSHDFEVAIEEGATIVRVGTAIFGERERQQIINMEMFLSTRVLPIVSMVVWGTLRRIYGRPVAENDL